MKNKILFTILSLLLAASLTANAYLYYEYIYDQNSAECPEGMVCKDFSWVDEYVEVMEGGPVQWSDCGEGVNKCARWEDYSGENPLPRILVKKCEQQGTRLENGEWVTGLPVGEHILVGTTVRPCEDVGEFPESDGIVLPDE